MYSKEIIIRFREADPAGILWFGNILPLVHDTFEDFIVHSGFTWKEWFTVGQYLIPIRHLNIDFLSPFIPGNKYVVNAGIESMSESSFKMKYEFLSLENQNTVHAQVSMVHTFLDANTKQKISLPAKVRSLLKEQLWPTAKA